jgi:DNA repair protein RadC
MTPECTYTVSSVRKRRRKNRKSIEGPESAVALLRPLVRDQDREAFYGIYLNTRNCVLAIEMISLGSLNASIVHPREVFKPALRLSAASLLVVHNHPSGDPEPSEDDLEITKRLRDAGDILGIPLLDHVILGQAAYRSLREDGQI